MDTSNAITNRRTVHYLLCWLPRRMKRLVLVASFAAITGRLKENDARTLSKLNELLHLTSRESRAIDLPVYASKVIWEHGEQLQKTINEIQTQRPKECMKFIQTLVSNFPKWIMYTDAADVVHDLLTVVDFQPTQLDALSARY